jgi:hypothetical protein
MQPGSTSGNRAAPSTRTPIPGAPSAPTASGVPVVEEDSGLHDIRSLAQTAKQRISSKRESTHPPVSDDELLASSSASWKNLALPKPANMVSLPELDQLPSKAELKADQKAMAKAARAAAVEPAPELGSSSQPSRPTFAPQLAARAKSNKTRNLAIAGMGLAAAAGIALFVTTQKQNAATPTPSSDRSVASAQPIAATAPTVQHIDEPADTGAAGSGAVANPEGSTASAGAPAGSPPAVDMPAPPPAKIAVKHMGKSSTVRAKAPAEAISKTDTAPPAAAPKPEATKEKKAGDPSFDALLKEAGVNEKKDTKPVLDRKELSGSDFKSGMAAISAKAQACFKGTQGTATVKLVIASSGHVSKVTVSGVFAGKPEADCVVSAVKSATFPAWDGGSQSMGYSYLLSE